ncbi:TetR family transcriptional regulator [Gemmobacter fulvus]|uniref:TetR family transcriptional regulator n=1 Tax=Gemmobacter fulvus TaxID=2840474 RepID=A0A975P439_9RHOB|nr:TetR family transcriptional regulator [Gemmobacter fulvus]MBT9245661.1 TetR family transcriptional regulator [Gemmobacter fulvus]QWK89485.1 TetR family transcriptional regulator [Gemmobacter fulvus]
MARKKLIPDTAVFAEIRHLMAQGGEKAVSFSTISQATGLAAATLVQRFGSRDAMLRAALAAAWDALEATTTQAEGDAALNAKGAQALLKALGADAPETSDLTLLAADFRDPVLRARAETWRAQVETALALRLGGGAKGRETAALLFAAWQGQMLWQMAGGKGFRLKDAVKRLSD